jgi:hypothetical protein
MCFAKNSPKKILFDVGLVALIALLVLGILPQGVAFVKLAAAHTTSGQKLLHAAAMLACVLFTRSALMVYKKPWRSLNTMAFFSLFIADAVACVLYVVMECAFGSVYPYLITLCMFALLDVVSFFARLFYQVVMSDS